MRALIALDHVQLCRIEDAIVRIKSSPPIAQRRAAHLLAALESEKTAIVSARSGKRKAHRPHFDA